ncbi:unnamed protein product [Oikopleura dioica]|uniref:Uncharacterized protein n=1 Tax=Oikopleura dioica TaxID=34765 RepID=E4Z7C2_OIKDI|nr:unnamed protein product [Oikopleura dioica]
MKLFYSAHFGENYIRELGNTGTTSPVEYLHALMIRRRIWVKGTFAGIADLRYEVAGALSVLIYNEGQDRAFRKILEKCNYRVAEAGLLRIQREEEVRKSRCSERQKKKSQIQNLRRKAQKQFTQLGTYASRAQRDMDNARMNHIAKEKKEED